MLAQSLLWLVLVLAARVAAREPFHHAARHATVAIKETLYIVGGEITRLNSSTNSLSTTASTALDKIDLSVSWTNKTIGITGQNISTPSLQSGAAWPNRINDSTAFVTYDGGISLAEGPRPAIPDNQLELTMLGSDFADSVDTKTLTPDGNFSTLVRVQEAGYTYGGGRHYALGGFSGPATVPNATDDESIVYAPGLVMHNISTDAWYNVSAGGQHANGSANSGAIFLPNFGPVGLFMPLGGWNPQASKQISLDRLDVYEPQSDTWASQMTTGSIPAARQNPCVVGLPGDNGTYEIFLYGGYQSSRSDWEILPGDIYILTLPAFHWFRVSTSVLGRYRHTCNVAGQRQMISIGGIVAIENTTTISFDNKDADPQTGGQDPWTESVGVFDLSDLKWKDKYDPKASAYTTPPLVSNYTIHNGTVRHDLDPNIKKWFSQTRDLPTKQSASTSDAAQARPDAGVIAGAVIGGLIIGAAFVCIVFWLVRMYMLDRKKSSYAAVYNPSRPHSPTNGQQLKEYSRDDVVELLPRNRP